MTAMLFAEVVFELTAPAAVAAPERVEPGSTVHQPVARDGWGRQWIPPTSLAGHFRAHLGPELGPVLMGEEREGGEDVEEADGKRPGRPSAVRFLGTEVRLPEDGGTLHRTRTAIDRTRAAARRSTLRTGEYLPPGTVVTCRLRVDGAPHHRAVLDALRTWSPVVGGGRSTGFGTTRPVSVRHNTVDLATAEGRRMWLLRGGRELFTGEHEFTPEPVAAAPALVRADWEIVDALHIGSGRRYESAERHPEQRSSEPALAVRDDTGRPFVPGTAWKGVLRGRCEYVLASLGLAVCVGSEGTCGRCAVCTAFGWSSDGTDGAGVSEEEGRESVGGRARLRFADSPVTGEALAVRQHVALDRFTGGARSGLLYAEEVVETGRVTLEVRADGEVPPVVVAALELALYDLHTGRLGVGGGTTRGYGTLRRADLDEDALRARRDEAARVLARAVAEAEAAEHEVEDEETVPSASI